MSRRTFLLAVTAIVAATLAPAAPVEAGEETLLVVVNKANTTGNLSKDQLRPIYLTTKTQWGDGEPIVALNLSEDQSGRKAFDQTVLGMDPDTVARYWIDRKIRGGARPPLKAPNTSTAAKLVAKNVGAIAYVYKTDLVDGIKVVAKVTGGQVTAP